MQFYILDKAKALINLDKPEDGSNTMKGGSRVREVEDSNLPVSLPSPPPPHSNSPAFPTLHSLGRETLMTSNRIL